MIRRTVLLTLAVCSFSLTMSISAQNSNATVTGIVTDSGGNVIPDANVEITDVATAVSNTAQTNHDGIYRIAGLVPGTYREKVTKQGFKSSLKEDIVLHIQDVTSLNFSLEVGSVSESVTVEAGEPLIQSQATSLSQVIEGRMVQDTPLNGRNVLNLVALVPGVVAQGGTQGNPVQNTPNGWGNYQIGGGMANQSSTYVDGSPVNVSYVNLTSLIPTQDAVQEFRVFTNNVPPDYGRFAGGVVNFSTKSGTNEIHGTAYDYLRNAVLNANNFFNNRTGQPRPPFTQNQYGVTVGGPIKRDKIFGFFSWEGFALRTATPLILSVPTAAMRAGDFTAVGINIYDPYTTHQNANGAYSRAPLTSCDGTQANVICSSRIDPTAKALLNLFPLPNLPGNTNNYTSSPSTGGNYNQYIGRVDWPFSEKQHFFARYSYWGIRKIGENPFGNSTGRAPTYLTTHQFVVGDDYAINSTTFATLRLSYLRFIDNAIPLNLGTDVTQFGPAYAALSSQMLSHQNPVPNISGVSGADFQNQDTFVFSTSNNFTLSGNVSKVIDKHTLSIGGEVRKIEWYDTQNNDGGGYFNFDQNFTAMNPLSPSGSGYALASFLLGTPSSGSLNNVERPDTLQWYYGGFAHDVFQVTHRLTLDAGLRWEQPGSFTERRNWLTVLAPNAPDPLSASTGLNLQGQVALADSPLYPQRTQQQLHWNLFSPRVGITYLLREGTVFRGGYGISYLPNDVGWANALYSSPVNQASTTMATSLDGNLTPDATLSNPFPGGLTQPIGHNINRLGELEGNSVSSPLSANSFPYAQQWNVNVEQQFGNKTVLQVSYGGAKGTHLPVYQVNLNQLPLQYNSMGSALLQKVPNPFYGKLPSTAATLGGSPTIAQGYLLAPHPQFLNYTSASPFIGASNYNSLQVRFQRSLGAGGNLLVSYTWAKLISNTDSITSWLEANVPPAALQDNYNLHADHSLSANDVPQNLVVSYALDIPVGRGKRLFSNLDGISQAIVGGWSLSGVSTFRSGFPLSFTAQPTTLSTNFGAGTPRPNVVSGCQKQVTGRAQSRLSDWFNKACFTQPNAFGFGDESRTDTKLQAAGIANWDMGLSKGLFADRRVKLTFRSEVFNLANRVQFAPPGTALSTGQFGVVTSQYNLPRVFQFSLRAAF